MSDKDMEDFKKEQEAATEALKLMMQKGDAITWPEARPFYMQRFNGWIKDAEPHDLIKMLDRLQGQLEAACDHYAPKLTERDALEVAAKHIAIADCRKWETLPEGDERDVHRGRTCRLYYRYLAKSAFSAAGVRWKEEA